MDAWLELAELAADEDFQRTTWLLAALRHHRDRTGAAAAAS